MTTTSLANIQHGYPTRQHMVTLSMTTPPTITRFAPSPTGQLHLGHIYSALFARARADADGGKMLLRIDDIDHTRCRDEFRRTITDDLSFMGIKTDGPVMVQSNRLDRYQTALEDLKDRGLVYPCFLTRRELDGLLSAPHGIQAPHNTDQNLSGDEAEMREAMGDAPAWRLRMDAVRPLAEGLYYTEEKQGELPLKLDQLSDVDGDVVVARKDIGTSYHLSVVLDDADSGVTHVTRGNDLKDVTPLHRLLYHLLGLDVPIWCHHPLITDDTGKRLAKRDHARSIAQLRDSGMTAADIHQILSEIKPK